MKHLSLLLALSLVAVSTSPASDGLSNTVFQKHRPAVEAAVDRALTYLAVNQSTDGTFSDS